MSASRKLPERGDVPPWPANKAVLLTLVVVALTYMGLSLVALAGSPQVLVGLPVVVFGSRYWWSATQRLVRFMLTGEILPADAAAGADTRCGQSPQGSVTFRDEVETGPRCPERESYQRLDALSLRQSVLRARRCLMESDGGC